MNTNKVILFVSVSSLIISVTALCVICIRNNHLNFDWYGALIGVLSLLVTVLIGWNIYIGIDFDKRIEMKIEKALSKIEYKVEYTNDRTTYTLFANIASIMKEQANSLLAFDMFLRAALFSSKAKDHDITRGYLINAIDIFDVMTTDKRFILEFNIFKSELRKLDDYIDILKLIDSELSNTLITRIVLAREK